MSADNAPTCERPPRCRNDGIVCRAARGLRERLKLRTLRYSVHGRLVRVICQARRRRLGDRGLLPADGQTTDSDASVVDDGDGPDVEVCFQSGQVGEEDHYLFVRSPARDRP